MRLSRSALFVFALVLMVAGCSGEDTSTPTSPGDPVRLSLSLATTSSHTIRVVKMFFDGREVATAQEPGGSGQVRIEATVSASRGLHTVRLVVVDQASSPNQYFVSGSITTPTRILDLARQDRLLATGQALDLQVDL